MFDRTFFKFAFGLAAIIAASMLTLYFAGYFETSTTELIQK